MTKADLDQMVLVRTNEIRDLPDGAAAYGVTLTCFDQEFTLYVEAASVHLKLKGLRGAHPIGLQTSGVEMARAEQSRVYKLLRVIDTVKWHVPFDGTVTRFISMYGTLRVGDEKEQHPFYASVKALGEEYGYADMFNGLAAIAVSKSLPRPTRFSLIAGS